MACSVCGRECKGSFCEECKQLMRRMIDTYDLRQLSTIFVYLLGTKAVEDLQLNAAAALTEEYINKHLREELKHAQSESLQ